jgi:hypothetical protein
MAALLGGVGGHLGWQPLSTATDRAGHRQPPPDGGAALFSGLF